MQTQVQSRAEAAAPSKVADESSIGTVKLITATRVPARHTRIVKARVDGIDHGSAALLDPEGKVEESGLWIEKGLLQQDGGHCVCIPVLFRTGSYSG